MNTYYSCSTRSSGFQQTSARLIGQSGLREWCKSEFSPRMDVPLTRTSRQFPATNSMMSRRRSSCCLALATFTHRDATKSSSLALNITLRMIRLGPGTFPLRPPRATIVPLRTALSTPTLLTLCPALSTASMALTREKDLSLTSPATKLKTS